MRCFPPSSKLQIKQLELRAPTGRYKVWKIIRRVGSACIVLVTGVCLTRTMTITRSYCCREVQRMQNLIEFVQGAARRIAFAYRESCSVVFIFRCSSKVARECFIEWRNNSEECKSLSRKCAEMGYINIHIFNEDIQCTQYIHVYKISECKSIN